MKKTIRLIVGIILAVTFLRLMFKHITFDEVKKSFNQANLFFLSMALLSVMFGYSCRVQRWRIMLMQDNETLQWKNCVGPLVASVAANNVLPLRAGDILRAFYFNKKLGVTASTSLTTLFLERLLDLLMVISFLGFSVVYFKIDSNHLIGLGGRFFITSGILILIILLFPNVFKPIILNVFNRIEKIFPVVGKKIVDQIHKIFDILEYASGKKVMSQLIIWSFLAWINEGMVFWFVAISLSSISHPLGAWIALPIGTLATVIPSMPGYVGTFDFFTAHAMSAIGNTMPSSIAYALLIHALLWLPLTLLGGIYLLINPVKQHEKLGEPK
jgi:glycosyltransferase 2 family protein